MANLVKSLAGKTVDFFRNPVLIKELRINLREKKLLIGQSIHLLVLGIVLFLYLLNLAGRSSYNTYYIQNAGRDYFKTICVVQWFMIVLVAPSLTSSAISSERENKTYDLLLVSLLRTPEILLGKLAYAASYLFLLLSASLPIVSVVFLLGGVSPGDIFINYIAILAWGILASIVGLFFSSRETRSSVATNQSYGLLILAGLIIVPTYIGYVVNSGNFISFSTRTPDVFIWIPVYLNILWVFMFFFFKISNNLMPRAKNILALHWMFVAGFLINVLGALALLVASSFSQPQKTVQLHTDELGAFWAVFSMGAMLFMGCFIEKHRFLSKLEQRKLENSPTSKSYFFPAYFILVAFLITVIVSFIDPTHGKSNIISFFVFIFFLLVILGLTGAIKTILGKKVRKVYIYFPLLIAVNLIPLLTWLAAEALRATTASKHLSIFSFVFAQPVLNFIAIWNPTESYATLPLPGGKSLIIFHALIFYLSVLIFFKAIAYLVKKSREFKASAKEQPAADGENNSGV